MIVSVANPDTEEEYQVWHFNQMHKSILRKGSCISMKLQFF